MEGSRPACGKKILSAEWTCGPLLNVKNGLQGLRRLASLGDRYLAINNHGYIILIPIRFRQLLLNIMDALLNRLI